MKPARRTPKPDETISSPVGGRHGKPDEAKPEVTNTEGTGSTPSFRPEATTPAEPKTSDEEYILEREADGRYRIVGRRPRK
jgi:hypothetical protein